MILSDRTSLPLVGMTILSCTQGLHRLRKKSFHSEIAALSG
jgi:hypothetical protein